jgi:hypothetical protein
MCDFPSRVTACVRCWLRSPSWRLALPGGYGRGRSSCVETTAPSPLASGSSAIGGAIWSVAAGNLGSFPMDNAFDSRTWTGLSGATENSSAPDSTAIRSTRPTFRPIRRRPTTWAGWCATGFRYRPICPAAKGNGFLIREGTRTAAGKAAGQAGQQVCARQELRFWLSYPVAMPGLSAGRAVMSRFNHVLGRRRCWPSEWITRPSRRLAECDLPHCRCG